MMLLQSGSFWISSLVVSQKPRNHHRPHMIGSGKVGHLFLTSPSSTSSNSSSCTCVSKLCSSNVEINDIIHNKVLISAAVSAAIGQILKPFTKTILYGKNFDFKIQNAFQAGGFPSSHSSATVATATTLGLERGFSDAIFGLAVVYACLIMYDAQGVRREVGIHAKVLNRLLYRNKLDSVSSSKDAIDFAESFPKESPSNSETRDPPLLRELGSFQQRHPNAPLLLKSDDRCTSAVKGESESIPFGCTPLKESVGHTEIEVLAGALLGFFVSVAVCTI